MTTISVAKLLVKEAEYIKSVLSSPLNVVIGNNGKTKINNSDGSYYAANKVSMMTTKVINLINEDKTIIKDSVSSEEKTIKEAYAILEEAAIMDDEIVVDKEKINEKFTSIQNLLLDLIEKNKVEKYSATTKYLINVIATNLLFDLLCAKEAFNTSN